MSTLNSIYSVDLLTTSNVQFRHGLGGSNTPASKAYQAAMVSLARWGRATGNSPQVHALVHLGWCSGSGARATCSASTSAAFKAGQAYLTVGEPAAPQVAALVADVATLGAPADAVATVWATFTGTPQG